jgi:hypothetical protein
LLPQRADEFIQAMLAQHERDQLEGFGGLGLSAQRVIVHVQVKTERAQLVQVKVRRQQLEEPRQVTG